ncbi:MAG: non-canonical purine NTP diphosphatase [Bacteroidales bacterium]|nr:non-canonical purine NTP diphosphatase [Bacteroidales bacterium]
MTEIVFATNNLHKLEEIRHAVGREIKILSLTDIGCFDEIPEDADTIEKNASQKSLYIYHKYGRHCFADDTGLEIEALDGRPGVFSARYAGRGHDHQKNMYKVLREMEHIDNRNARFRTVISLILDGTETLFEGVVSGKILNERKGTLGFGYDPIFQPDGYQVSFAQMDLDLKNKISHRGLAIRKLLDFLRSFQ